MNRLKVVLIALFAVILGIGFLLKEDSKFSLIQAATTTVQSLQKPQLPEHKLGEIIVKFKDNVQLDKPIINLNSLLKPSETTTGSKSETLQDHLTKKRGVKTIQPLFKNPKDRNLAKQKHLLNVYKLTFDKPEDIEKKLKELSSLPEVEIAEPNYIYKTQFIPNDPYYLDSYPANTGSRSASWSPNYDYQWNLKKIDMEHAWDVSLPNTTIVAVIDTGVDYTHPELGGCTLSQVTNNNCQLIAPGHNFITQSDDPEDDFGHGTHVAGIIAAIKNNGVGIAGMSENVRIMPLKALDSSGFGDVATLGDAVIYAADYGAKVINASWGGFGKSLIMDDAFSYAYSKGVVSVVAAGNSNTDVATFFPANVTCATPQSPDTDCTLTVGATDQRDKKSFYSNFGSGIDVTAPGGDTSNNIISLKSNILYPDLSSLSVDNLHLRLSGTSMAAPHVAALTAMVLAKNNTLTQNQVRNIILNGADDLGTPSFDGQFGYGRINANKTLTEMNTATPATAKIKKPLYNFITGDKFKVFGSSFGQSFSSFTVGYADSPTSSNWLATGVTLSNNGTSQVKDDILATIDWSNLTDNKTYYLKLTTFTGSGSAFTISPIKLDKSIRENFPLFSGVISSFDKPVIADINGDGKKEIIFQNKFDGSINAIEPDGSSLPGWPLNPFPGYTGSILTPSPVVADLDPSYPGLEVIVTVSPFFSGMQPLAFHADGTEVLHWNINDWLSKGSLAYPTDSISAITINGQTGIVFPETTQYISSIPLRLHVFNKDAQEFPGFPVTAPSEPGFLFTPHIADVNKDGKLEIVTGFYNGRKYSVRIYGQTGNLIKDLPINEVLSDVELGDLDKDGFYEIVATAEKATVRRVYAWDGRGWMKSGWPYNLPSTASPRALSIGDFNNDGFAEVYVNAGANNTSVSTHYIIGKNGKLISSSNENWPALFSSNISLNDGNHLFAFNSNYNTLGFLFLDNYNPVTKTVTSFANFPKTKFGFEYIQEATAYATTGFPSLVDLDNDGKLELVTQVTYGLTQDVGNSYLFVYNLNTTYKNADWPQFAHDAFHSGAYAYPPISTPTPTVIPTATPAPTSIPTATPIITPTPTGTIPPFIVISSPQDGAVLTTATTVTANPIPSYTNNAQKIKLYVDGAVIKDCNYPINVCSQYYNPPVGLHHIWATGYDKAVPPNFTTSTTVTVTR